MSHVEERVIGNDHTFSFAGRRYQIVRADVQAGMRRQRVRVELRLNGELKARYQGRYVDIGGCDTSPKASALRFHQSNGSRQGKTLLALRKDSRVLRHRRAFADCFGANPVASALGDPARRDPGEAMRTLPRGSSDPDQKRNFLLGWEQELSIWLRQKG